MATAVDIVVNIITKLDSQGVEQAQGKLGKFGTAMGKLTGPAVLAGAAVAGFAAKTISSASRLQQSMGAVDSVFGKNADTVKRWSESSATAVGLATSEYQELATVIGAQLGNMGVAQDQVAGKTKSLITLGSDLAATYGGTTAEAVGALSAVLRGETDPIERYGVSIKQADIAARQAKEGTDNLTGAQAKAAKTQATLALLSEQTAKAQGQFARETDSAAGSAQIASASFENASAALGTALLPAAAAAATTLADLAGWAQENADVVLILVGVVGGLAAAVLAINAGLAIYNATVVAVTAAQWLWNAAMAANPVGLVAIAILAVVAALILAYKRSEKFRAIVDAAMGGAVTAAKAVGRAMVWVKDKFVLAFQWIKSHWKLILAILTGPVGVAVLLIAKYWDKIKAGAKAVLDWIKSYWRTIWSAVVGIVRGYINTITTVIDKVKAAAKAVADWLSGAWETAWDTAAGAVEDAVDLMTAPFDALLKVIGDIVSAVKNIDFPSPPGWFSKIPGVKSLPVPTPATYARSVAPYAAPRVRSGTVGRVAAASAGGGPTVIVNGALDPEAVARQIRKILTDSDRRNGRR